jgi:iron complex outermembrane receptor protein
LLYAGDFYADNANSVETGDYVVSNFRTGFRWQAQRWSVEPYFGVNNLLDERYMSNIRLNAAFGRYYEPAPGRHVYGGVVVSYSFE